MAECLHVVGNFHFFPEVKGIILLFGHGVSLMFISLNEALSIFKSSICVFLVSPLNHVELFLMKQFLKASRWSSDTHSFHPGPRLCCLAFFLQNDLLILFRQFTMLSHTIQPGIFSPASLSVQTTLHVIHVLWSPLWATTR